MKLEEDRGELHYRPDIDGLRAVAVMAVVFYHFGFWQVPGGFVGVDVFFVISGFLITGLIHREMQQGRFTIAHFYERRVRRIFPALFVMLAAATVAAGLLLFPVDFESYARSLAATAIFASNFEFWREAGYFDVASAQKPLLHLWSIAVEEQFYLLFPALLLAIGTRSLRRLRGAVGLLFLLSLGFSLWAVVWAPAAAFYLLPSRMWELMLGALLALGVVPQIRAQVSRELLAIAGVIMIAAAVILFRPWQAFPGLAALLPCLGAACVIHAGGAPTIVTCLLSRKPVVFVGLISYSLYLWHWPVLVFGRMVLNGEPGGWQNWALMAVSAALAALSWRFVERPIRRGVRLGWRPFFAGAAGAMGLTLACGVAVASANGVPERWQPEIRSILAAERSHEPRMDACFGRSAADVNAGRLCRIGSAAAKTPTFLLWGDSHADALLPAIQQVAGRRGRAGLFAGSASCAPLLGVARSDVVDCKPFNDAVVKLALEPGITEVILDARWAKEADDPFSGAGGPIVLSDATAQSTDTASMEAVFYRGLERVVRVLTEAGKRVVIVAPVPEAGYSVPRTLARLRLAGDRRELTRSLSTYFKRQKFVFFALTRMRQSYGATVLYPHQILCATGVCEFALKDRPLYRDEHHLSVFGALRLIPIVAQAF